ncbi:alpha/beta fold hydrolase [Nonomuraea sp. NPDC049709]|uniref:alpha/beta hydrolase n=1 Tax=Nonomuraea sp. NPDC049709 TaxID=3154736 RepID=UPI0034486381
MEVSIVLERIHVVFIHGLLSSARAWTQFADLVARDPAISATVVLHHFAYDSPFVRFRLDRRIAEVDDLADRLETYLRLELGDAERIMLVTHSQGGLVVQRFLARTLAKGRGRDLVRIKRIVMYACPNSGSEFLLSLRRLTFFWRNPQERQLRPFTRAVVEAQEAVLRAVVNAQGCSDTECRIPIAAYGGVSDKIVPPIISKWVFPETGLVDGDHFTVIRPADHDSSCYRVFKAALMSADEPLPAAGPGTVKQLGPVSIAPPFGRRDAPLQGRTKLISSIRSAKGMSNVHVLAGLGGLGKSRLALEIAYWAQQNGRRIWWVSMPQVSSSMREIANQLGAPAKQVESAWVGVGSASDLVWRFLNECPDRWLLIFDNADHPELLGPLIGQVPDGTGWLRPPMTDKGTVLVTTRDRRESTWGPWSTVHRVPPLEAGDGAAMLMDRVGDIGESVEEARLLSEQLGGLPLALRAAADYVKSEANTRIRFGDDSIRSFRQYRTTIKRRFESPPGSNGHELDESLGPEIVQNVINLSLELLRSRGLPQAGALLKLFACLNTAPIPYRILLDTTVLADSPLFSDITEADYHTALRGLEDLGLVEPESLASVTDPELHHVLTLHPVVHGLLRESEEVRQRRADYYGLDVRLLLNVTQSLSPDLPESWAVWGLLAPHVIEVSRSALLGSPPVNDVGVLAATLELSRITLRYLIVTGLIGPAQDLADLIVGNCASFGFDRDDREILGIRHEQGRIALERGNPQAAEEELRQVIEARARILGENHADTLASRHKLAKAISEQGRWDEAEPLLRSIVIAENEVRGPEHSDTMVVRHSLARAILAQGRQAEAERMLRDILEVRDRIWSPLTPETLYTRQTLARALMEQGKVREAEDELRNALNQEVRRNSPLVMSLRHTASLALIMKGELHQAISELTLLLEDRRKVLGLNHPETFRTSQLLEKIQGILDQVKK